MRRILFVVVAFCSAAIPAAAQGTQADYDRALGLRKKYEALVGNAAEAPRWVGRTHKVYYRRMVKGGHDFVLADADTKAKGPAFDHAKIAASLSTAIGKTYGALDLPFNAFDFVDNDRAIQFVAESATWRCEVAASTCRKATPAEMQQGGGGPRRTRRRRRRRGTGRARRSAGRRHHPGAPVARRHEGSADLELQPHRARRGDEEERDRAQHRRPGGEPHAARSIVWSPDSSKRIAAYRVRPGYPARCTSSSRRPQISCSPNTRQRLQQARRCAPSAAARAVRRRHAEETPSTARSSPTLRPVALQWRKDSSAVTFEYNQRGHQVFRVIEANAATGKARAVISEEPATFFDYRTANCNLADSGKKPLRPRGRQGRDLDVGARRLEPSLPDGRRHRAREKPDHEGAVGGAGVNKVDKAAKQIFFRRAA